MIETLYALHKPKLMLRKHDMTTKDKKFYSRSSVWIVDENNNVVFGFGRFRILKAIQRHGSIQGAAKELKIGYRAIWARIKATEERLGEKLLIKTIGGPTGGGSQLTPLAETLLEQFQKLQKHVEKETDKTIERLLGTHLTLNK